MRGLEFLRQERGSTSVFAICVVSVLMLLAGLCIDGGRVLNARASLKDAAEQAARAGAQKVQHASVRESGAVVIDAPAAASAARTYMKSSGAGSGSIVEVSTAGGAVTVKAHDKVRTGMLSLVGVRSIDIDVTATAHAVGGVSEREF